MTNREKWQKKLAEAEDGYKLLDVIDEMDSAHLKWCIKGAIETKRHDLCLRDCRKCKVKWLNSEVKEDD